LPITLTMQDENKMIDAKAEDVKGEIVSIDRVTLEMESSSIIQVEEERGVLGRISCRFRS
jgi:hypothetical protein